VRYVQKGLRKDTADTPVQICTVSPGIVVTDLLTGDYDLTSEQWEKSKKIFNILGDEVHTVAPWLVEQILATDKSGVRVAWLTRRKAFGRFMTAAFNRRDLFAGVEES
jgi:NADP-dependent 3-hydroxy acid dehydrogenase YdfG